MGGGRNKSPKRALSPNKATDVSSAPGMSSKRSRSLNKRMELALRIAKQLLMNNKDYNIVFSPLSINVLLSLVAAGSGGATLDQFLNLLDCETLDDINSLASKLISVVSPGGSKGGPKLSFASGVWLKQSLTLKDSFQQVVDSVHKTAALNRVDFETKYEEVVKEVNLWAEKMTHGLIKEILPSGSVDPDTILVLANALYFKGAWLNKFNQSMTKRQKFHLSNGSSVRVPFMTSREDQFLREFYDFKVLKLPYGHGKKDEHRFSMYFFLPDAIDGLPALSEKLLTQPGFLENHLPVKKNKVRNFKIPRFKMSFGFEAKDLLKELDLTLPFDKFKGGLTEMVHLPDSEWPPVVTGIFHKSFVEVNEEGTEAAAASASCILVPECYCPVYQIDFVADHPFLFIIRDDMTGVVLFIGQVLDPSKSN